jgi:hypothetical protein
MRLLVCGGRDFSDAALLERTLDAIHSETPVTVLVHGAARGADTLAAQWAKSRGVEALAFPADWERDGKAAGHLRNARMLEEGRPDAILVFPGGRGTADMVARSRRAGLPVSGPGAPPPAPSEPELF